MKINTLFCPTHVEELYFTGKTVAVIDVLRATTTIITALNNGAKEIIPVGNFEFAMKISGSMFGGQTLLGGERNTKKIDGFNLGNSPLEYKKETVSGKSIVLLTTNGSKAVVKTKFSDTSVICAFLNLSTVAKYLASLNKDMEIVCSARSGFFSLEDAICAGKLASEIASLTGSIEKTDSTNAAIQLAKSFGKNLKKMLYDTVHGKLLIENGFEEDLKYCAKLNSTEIIPVFSSGSIKIFQPPSENITDLSNQPENV
jgi:2-phosphosulfolactate phosphatase